jgi:hypothetical protein
MLPESDREGAMAEPNTLELAELRTRLAEIAGSHGGTPAAPDANTVTGRLTAIKAQWFLGGRKVTSSFRCTLDPVTHEVRFRESAVETSWGLPPPTLSFQTRSQVGSRVTVNRIDRGIGGGGELAFGAFRERCERAVREAGWTFVYEVG